MSKKKFTNGLESVFIDTYEEEVVTTSVFEEQRAAEIPAKAKQIRKGGKTFSSDINDIIMSSFVTENQEETEDSSDINYSHVKKPQRRPLSGLEALLSRTIDYGDLDVDAKKRIVLLLEQHKVEKLKEIAKEEQLFLKDILVKSISFYIDQHEKRRR
jgi:hypothetical protein